MTGACIHQAILCMCVFYCFCFVVYFSVVGLGVGGLLFAHYSMNFQAHFIFMPTVHNSRLCHCQCVSYSVFFSSWFMTLLVQLELAWWLVGLEFDICHRTTMTFAWWLVGVEFDICHQTTMTFAWWLVALEFDICHRTTMTFAWRLVGLAFDMSPDNHDFCMMTCWFRVWHLSPDNRDFCTMTC